MILVLGTECIFLQLIQVQGELKQKKRVMSDQSSPTDKQSPAQIQQVCETQSNPKRLANEILFDSI